MPGDRLLKLATENERVDSVLSQPPIRDIRQSLPPAWRSFLHFCERMGNGEIQQLKVQDGLPVVAEAVTRRVRFSP